jgi:hypothetical protein
MRHVCAGELRTKSLYSCFTTALLAEGLAPVCLISVMFALVSYEVKHYLPLLLSYCFTAALLLLYYCLRW